MTLILVLSVLLSWGAAGIFDKKSLSHGGAQSVFVVFQLFNLPLLAGMFLLLNLTYGQWHLSGGLFFWEGLNAASALVAMLAYFYAMSRAQASYIIGITAGYPVFGKLLAIPFLGEEFSLPGLTGAALVSLGVAAIGFSRGEPQQPTAGKATGDGWKVALAVAVATVLWAVLGIFEKKSLAFGRPFEAYTVLTCWKSLLAVLVLLTWRGSVKGVSASLWKFSWISAALVTAGNLAFIVALSASDAGYMIVMTAAYPLVVYAGAMIWLRERLITVRVLGMALVLSGCIVSELFH